ncbi:MAG: addiction module protein [Bacteroidia bacterium]|nr:addiction module protein [Bacteroidia bacterium]
MALAVDTIREKLHHYIDQVDAKKIKAFYTIVEADIEEEPSYSDAFKAELDQRYRDFKSGKAKMISGSESKKRIQKLLKNKFNR